MAQNGTSLIHDISFHVPAIFVSNEVLKRMQEQTRMVRLFGRYLRDLAKGGMKNSAHLSPKELVDLAKAIEMNQLLAIDTTTANLATTISIFFKTGKIRSVHRVIDRHLHESLGDGASPRNFLLKTIVAGKDSELARSQV